MAHDSDFPAPAEHPLHPAAERIQAYLEAYARAFGVVDHIRFKTLVEELRARGGLEWRGGLPNDALMLRTIAQPRPPPDAHNALGLTLSEDLGVAPEPIDWRDLGEPLLFGPMLPPRYRLSGPGAIANARVSFAQQLAASPRALADPADVDALRRIGWHAAAATIAASRTHCPAGSRLKTGPRALGSRRGPPLARNSSRQGSFRVLACSTPFAGANTFGSLTERPGMRGSFANGGGIA